MPFKYLRTRFNDYQWICEGECIKWDSLLTAKEIFGRMKAKYLKEPTNLWYNDGSMLGDSSCNLRRTEEFSGIATSFAPSMWKGFKSWWIWQCWEKNRPLVVGITSTLTKWCRGPLWLRNDWWRWQQKHLGMSDCFLWEQNPQHILEYS